MFDAGITPREIMQKVVLEEPVRVLKWEGHETVFALRDVRLVCFLLSSFRGANSDENEQSWCDAYRTKTIYGYTTSVLPTTLSLTLKTTVMMMTKVNRVFDS